MCNEKKLKEFYAKKVNFEALKHLYSSKLELFQESENDHVYLFKGIIIIHHIHKVGGKSF